MKVFLRHVLINLLVIYLAGIFYPGFSVLQDTKTLATAALIWLLLNKIVKPIIKLLLLPINLITLNLFAWVINLVTLFMLSVIVEGISINAYQFPGINFEGFVIPAMYISTFFSFVITSILLSLLHNFVMWLIRKDSK